MGTIIQWFKDNEIPILITFIFILIIAVIVGILVGLGFLIDYLVKKNHENHVLKNYKVVPYKTRVPVRQPNYLVSEFISQEEFNLLNKLREFKKKSNKKIRIISNIKNNEVIILPY